MTPFSFGFWLVHRTPLFDAAHADAVARLLTDPRWPWQPSLVRPTQRPGQPVFDWPKGKVATSKLRTLTNDIMRSERSQGIHLSTSRQDDGNHAWVQLDNGQPELAHASVAYPLEARGICRTSVPEGKSVEAWIGIVRELAVLVNAAHGVIWAGIDERPILARQFLTGGHQPKMPPDHPHNESARINRTRKDVGEQYVRLPGWAVFLRQKHLDLIGGIDAVRARIQPAVVDEVKGLTYVQLSSVDDALKPRTEERRRELAEMMAPISVPLL